MLLSGLSEDGHRSLYFSIVFIVLPLFWGTSTATKADQQSPFDGEYYSNQYRYGFKINDTVGVATVSNSPTFNPGDAILFISQDGPRSFVGTQLCTDGRRHPVHGSLNADGSLDMTIQGCGADTVSWRMIRVQPGSATIARTAPTVTQPPTDVRHIPGLAPAERRVALVIGNNTYLHQSFLDRAVSDAEAMRDTLQQRGFQVVYRADATIFSMAKATEEFLTGLNPGDIAVVYFAGHGANYSGVNYLVPTDSKVPDDGIILARLLTLIGQRRPRFALVMVDACQNDPRAPQEPRLRSTTLPPGIQPTGRPASDLSPVTPPPGMMIVYSAGVGQFAQDDLGDGDERRPHGLFVHEFLQYIVKPSPIKDVIAQVQHAVSENSKNQQVPVIYNGSSENIYFVSPNTDHLLPSTSSLQDPRKLIADAKVAIQNGDCERAKFLLRELGRIQPMFPPNANTTPEQWSWNNEMAELIMGDISCNTKRNWNDAVREGLVH